MSSTVKQVVRFVEDNPEIPVGTAVGFGAGVAESAAQVAIGCIQLAVYPLYMANCAVRPFIRLVSPTVIMPVYTALGAIGGAGYKALTKVVK